MISNSSVWEERDCPRPSIPSHQAQHHCKTPYQFLESIQEVRCFQHDLGYAEVSFLHMLLHPTSAEGRLNVGEGATLGKPCSQKFARSGALWLWNSPIPECLLFPHNQSEQACSFPWWVKCTQFLLISSRSGHMAPMLAAPGAGPAWKCCHWFLGTRPGLAVPATAAVATWGMCLTSESQHPVPAVVGATAAYLANGAGLCL